MSDQIKQWHERIEGEMNGDSTFKAMKAEINELRAALVTATKAPPASSNLLTAARHYASSYLQQERDDPKLCCDAQHHRDVCALFAAIEGGTDRRREMKIERTTATLYVITGAGRLDPIRVYTENYEPGKGRITLECFGRAWSAYWGGMSGGTVEQFFVRSGSGYLIDNLVWGMGGRLKAQMKREDEYLTRIIEAVQAAFREQTGGAA